MAGYRVPGAHANVRVLLQMQKEFCLKALKVLSSLESHVKNDILKKLPRLLSFVLSNQRLMQALSVLFLSTVSASDDFCTSGNSSELIANPAYTLQMNRAGELLVLNVDTTGLLTLACARHCCELVMSAINAVDGCRGLTQVSLFTGNVVNLATYPLGALGALKIDVPVGQMGQSLAEISACFSDFMLLNQAQHAVAPGPGTCPSETGPSEAEHRTVIWLAISFAIAAVALIGVIFYMMRRHKADVRAAQYASLREESNNDEPEPMRTPMLKASQHSLAEPLLDAVLNYGV